MPELIKEFLILLDKSYDDKDIVTVLRDFFRKNFEVELLDVILKEDYSSGNSLFPLTKRGQIIGHLEFSNVTEQLTEFLDIALHLISLKFQNIMLSENMQKAIDFQNAMKNIAKIIETQYELKFIIPLLGEMIDKFIQNHLVYIFIKRDDKCDLMWPNACNDNTIFDIIDAEPLKRITTGNLGVFPLVAENKLLGYIVTKIIDEKLTFKETEYLEELAKQSATTINRANVYAEILKHATLDALTGFYNRHQLDERIKQEVASSRRQKTPLCAIMTDIDFFKRVNDTYGHAVGDTVLKTVSKAMRSQLREYDVAGRFGGEEFAILLPFTKINEAQMVAHRLRETVENKKIKIQANDETSKEIEFGVTISLGVYELKTSDTDEDLLKNADKALYTAKKQGRNQVIVYE